MSARWSGLELETPLARWGYGDGETIGIEREAAERSALGLAAARRAGRNL